MLTVLRLMDKHPPLELNLGGSRPTMKWGVVRRFHRRLAPCR